MKNSDGLDEKADISKRGLIWGLIFVFVSGVIFGTVVHTLLAGR